MIVKASSAAIRAQVAGRLRNWTAKGAQMAAGAPFVYAPAWRGYLASCMSARKVAAMARVPLFSRCTRKQLEFLASRTDEVDLKANHTLIKQGSASDSFYVLLEGEATVEVDGRTRPSLHAGDFFVETGMLYL